LLTILCIKHLAFKPRIINQKRYQRNQTDILSRNEPKSA